jgi:catechol 2,3-dioxygenase-like lactoylglutathione lyase family enzyme
MKIKQLDHLNLSVRDLEETEDWYGRVFGFEVVERGIYNGAPWSILRAGDAMLCAYEHPERVSLEASIDAHRVNHFGFRIADPNVWRDTVLRQHIEVKYGGEVRWPYSTAWYVRDPSDYEIEVVHWDGDQISFGRGDSRPSS